MSAPTVAELEHARVVHALEEHQAELEAQNHALVATVAELRVTNTALELARDRFRALYEVAPVVLVTIDRGGSVLEANDAALAVLRAPRDHVIGRRLAVFVAEAGRAAFGELVTELFETRALSDRHTTIETDVATTDVALHGILLSDEGPARGVLAMVDVTVIRAVDAARHELDRRASELQRLESLAGLAGGVAHAFNNLLTVVIGGTDQLLATPDLSASSAVALGEVRDAACQAATMAHQMLAYSGHASVSLCTTDLGQLLRALAPSLAVHAKATPVVLELPTEQIWIRCDEAQVQQLVTNLVINAAESMTGRPGAITIGLHVEAASALSDLPPLVAAGPCAVLEVRDRGAGIAPTSKDRIFDPYFTTKFVGRGLGLAVVDGIVRAHHGALTVESVVDGGSTFRIYLPSVPPPAEAPATTATARTGPGTILVVDDDAPVRRVIVRALTRLGYPSVAAADGLQAVEQVRADVDRFDVVLMDMTMPNLNGVDAARAIHALRADLPVVLITGYGTIPNESEGIFVATLAKPLDVAALHELLQRLVRP